MEEEMINREVLNEREVREEYGFTIPFLRRARRERRGPRFLKVGKLVRYRRADIETYLAAMRSRLTSLHSGQWAAPRCLQGLNRGRAVGSIRAFARHVLRDNKWQSQKNGAQDGLSTLPTRYVFGRVN
jgi:hypothetical protein